MPNLTNKLNFSGKLIQDVGYDLKNAKYNIDIRELEQELDNIRNKVINAKSNKEAHSYYKAVFKKFKIKLIELDQKMPHVKLNAWVAGAFELPNNVTLYITYNTESNSITKGNFHYIKSQMIQILIHEVVHYCRFNTQKEADIDKYESIEENNLIKYLSQTEEMYAYSYQILFQLLTEGYNSGVLSWYNKNITDEKTVNKLRKIANKVSKTPIFRDKKCKFWIK